MKDEILNIDYWRRIYLVKALRKHKTVRLAAKALGIGQRTAWRWKRSFAIKKAEIK